jgi:hypothetical protein
MKQTHMSKPFFAQFLENQSKKEDGTQNGFPWPVPTRPLLDMPSGDVTQKFPSDWDDED